jgi:hypothetical protein
MTIMRALAHAKFHRYGCHTRNTSPWCHQIWWYMAFRGPVWGPPLFLGSKFLLYGPPLCLVGRPGRRSGGLAARASACRFLPTKCRSLVRGIRLVLLRAGNVESNPGPDGGPCVGCGLMPAANTRALLRCKEGCGRECYHREACSGLRRQEQRQEIWECRICLAVSGGVAPPQH